MNESRHTYAWVTSHIWMSHVTHMNESRHTYEWVTSHINSTWRKKCTRSWYLPTRLEGTVLFTCGNGFRTCSSSYTRCIHTNMHTYLHTYIHTRTYTLIHTYMRTYVHSHTHTYIQTYIHAFIYTYVWELVLCLAPGVSDVGVCVCGGWCAMVTYRFCSPSHMGWLQLVGSIKL